MARKMMQSALVLLLAFAVVAALGGCSKDKPGATPKPAVGKAAPQAAAPAEKASIRLKWFAYGNYVGSYVARDSGIWKNLGLDVTVHEGGPQLDSCTMVVTDSDQFGIASPDQLLIARSKGQPVVAVAALMQKTPIGFLVHADSGIKEPKDLLGKRMRFIPGHNSVHEYMAMMKLHGLDRSKVREIINTTTLQLFLNHEVDLEPIYVNYQPLIMKKRGIPVDVFKPSDFGIDSYGNILVASEKLVRENPKLVTRFIKGLLDGWRKTHADPAMAASLLVKLKPNLDPEIEAGIAAGTKEFMEREDGRMGWMTEEKWSHVIDLFQQGGVIEKKPDPKTVFTNRFMEEIYGAAPTAPAAPPKP
ncbi:MAG: ABC transporter substrate-binding protein [Candidatus Lernaella stagnicola]|nr:ABC transporter substrate-binding protein [Candidatus Lernaella stagnicola]